MASIVNELNQLNLAFAERFNARDLDGLVALNIAEVVFVPAPGQPVEGEANVRAALEQFLSLNLPITMTVRNVFQTGNTGLAIADWTINGTGPDGSEIALAGTTADVAVYDDEHGWRYVIDNPFGTA
ncbi:MULTISPECIES: nuclear transport factor 2 family protein [unclassified Diaminobutyricimonas]|uniref:YybH family protein n=1 Tax=unclassified Diaminobutyricimonas TaxID=2643261 RepID=UPI0012F4BF64|nr:MULTISPECIES: nuclear transport factor 2 family protein [unclassified Diaminobutyricimonas]